MTGGGAARYPGRWNDSNEPIVYCAPSAAMAVLETAAHVDDAALPLNRFLVRIEVPDEVWALREEMDIRKLPPTWSAIPAGRGSVQIGSGWLKSRRTPILLVPSVIVPEEWCALVNPKHAEAAKMKAKVVRAFEYNRLFRAQYDS